MRLSGQLAIAMSAFAATIVVGAGLLTYQQLHAAALPRILDQYDMEAELVATNVGAMLQRAPDDARRAAGARALIGLARAIQNGGTHPADGTPLPLWQDRAVAQLTADLADPLIAEIGVFAPDDINRPILAVRRDRARGAAQASVSEEPSTVRRGEAAAQALALPRGDVHVTPVQFDGSAPRRPVLRVATPIEEPGEPRFGALVLTYDLGAVLGNALKPRRSGAMHIVDAKGNLLAGDPIAGAAPSDGRVGVLEAAYPGIGHALAATNPQQRMVVGQDGLRYGIGRSTVRLAGGPSIAVIEVVPNRTVMATLTVIGEAMTFAGAISVALAVLVAILLARLITRPLARMAEEVASFVPGHAVGMPRTSTGEIAVLAAAFDRMASHAADTVADLRRQAGIFDMIMRSMSDMVMLFDVDARLVYANDKARDVLGIADTIGTDAWQNRWQVYGDACSVAPLHLEDRPILRPINGATVEGDAAIYRTQGGNTVDVVITARPISDSAGHPAGAVVVVRDVTEAKLADRQRREAQKLEVIGQLTGGIAHDFNNVLTVVLGTAELLAESADAPPGLVTYAQTIVSAANRGADLTRQLLTYARRQPLEPVRTDVNALVLEVSQLLRPTLGERFEIETCLEPDAWLALIDPSLLSSALLNLAVNARDAMPEGGRLTFETGNVVLDAGYARRNDENAAGEFVMIAVSDAGQGMSEAVLRRVFEPFFTTKEAGKGTGLGLSMVYGFAKQSGGHVEIASEVGRGTRVMLYLPRDMAAEETPRAPAPVETRGGHETVLLVEDDGLVRAHAIAQLRALGYRVLPAGDAAEALTLIDTGAAVDLLFTDAVLPGGMNGRQLTEAARARRPGMRVLYTSGYSEDVIVHDGRLDPGVVLLKKPYRRLELARKLREVLDSPAADGTAGEAATPAAA